VPADWIQQCIGPSIRNDEYGPLWWIIKEPAGAGYLASGYGGQKITVLGTPRAVIVYLSATDPNDTMADSDIEPLDDLFISTFL
jgi:hypothetical protein